jgi:hypothetical protein
MDVLIDLIIYLIKAAAKSREASAPRPAVGRQVAPTPQQIEAIQRTLAAQQARTKAAAPRPGRGPASWAQPGPRAAVPPVRQPPVPAITPAAAKVVPPRPAPAGIPGLKLPFLLGEVLSEPVSLRPHAHGGLSD